MQNAKETAEQTSKFLSMGATGKGGSAGTTSFSSQVPAQAPVAATAGVTVAAPIAATQAMLVVQKPASPFDLTKEEKAKVEHCKKLEQQANQAIEELNKELAPHLAIVQKLQNDLAAQRATVEKAKQNIKAIHLPNDRILSNALKLKLPTIKEIVSIMDRLAQTIKIHFHNCEDLHGIHTLMNAFLPNQFKIDEITGGYEEYREGPFNQTVIRVQIQCADREKLLQGLQLAASVPKVSSYEGQYRC